MSEVNKLDAMKIKQYYGCFISQCRRITFSKFCFYSRAPLLHLWNDHSHCRPEWCKKAPKTELIIPETDNSTDNDSQDQHMREIPSKNDVSLLHHECVEINHD